MSGPISWLSPRRFLSILVAVALVVSQTACATKAISNKESLIRYDKRLLSRDKVYLASRQGIGPQSQSVVFSLREQLTYEHFEVWQIDKREISVWPKPAGVRYVFLDVIGLKYLLPLGFGFFAMVEIIDEMPEKDQAPFIILTFFVGPLMLIAGGTAAGLILYSPIRILGAVFGAGNRKEPNSEFLSYRDKYIEDYESIEFSAEVDYFTNLADAFLTWLPLYPGFTNEFDGKITVTSTTEVERANHRKSVYEVIDPTLLPESLRVVAGGRDKLAPINGDDSTLLVPIGLFDPFCSDENLTVRIYHPETNKLMSDVSVTGSQVGCSGLIPRELPESDPVVTLHVECLDDSGDGAFHASEGMWLLTSIKLASNSVNAYGLRLVIDPGTKLGIVETQVTSGISQASASGTALEFDLGPRFMAREPEKRIAIVGNPQAIPKSIEYRLVDTRKRVLAKGTIPIKAASGQ